MKRKYKRKPKFTTADLKEKIDNHITRLVEETDQALVSETMKNFLTTASKFYRYSPNNQLLIMFGNPDATWVAGFTRWKKMGRFVKKGEQGIPILAPVTYRENPDDKDSPWKVRGFRVAYVFDVSQTEGDPLPPPPNWKSPARQIELEERLTAYAQSQEITVERLEMSGNKQGSSQGGKIELDEQAGTKTLIHEIAHELLHQNGNGLHLGRQTKEIEAEAVAYVVSSHFEIPDLASPNYIALTAGDTEKIIERQDRIRKAAAKIIGAVEVEAEKVTA